MGNAEEKYKDVSDVMKDLLPTCTKNTVKELLTSMSADTYTWMRDTVVKGRSATSIKYDIMLIDDAKNTKLSAVVLFVRVEGKDWKCEDKNMYIFHSDTVQPNTAKKVVSDMFHYYVKDILGLEV